MPIPIFDKLVSAFGGLLFDPRTPTIAADTALTLDDITHTGRFIEAEADVTIPDTLVDGFFCYVRNNGTVAINVLVSGSTSISGTTRLALGEVALLVKNGTQVESVPVNAAGVGSRGTFPPVSFVNITADRTALASESGTAFVMTGAVGLTLTLEQGAASAIGDYVVVVNNTTGGASGFVEPQLPDTIVGEVGFDIVLNGQSALYVWTGSAWQKIAEADEVLIPPWPLSDTRTSASSLTLTPGVWNNTYRNTTIQGEGSITLPDLTAVGIGVGTGIRIIATAGSGFGVDTFDDYDTQTIQGIPRIGPGNPSPNLSLPVGQEVILFKTSTSSLEWGVYYRGDSRPLQAGAATSLAAGVFSWGGLTRTINDTEITSTLRRLDFVQSSDPQSTLPEPLQALNNGAMVETITHTEFRVSNPDLPPRQAFAVLKNAPPLGTTVPIVAGDFVNEITNSLVTLTPPSNLGNVLIPRTVNNVFVDGVSSATRGVLTGPGIDEENFIINMPDAENPNLVIGMWLYLDNAVTQDEAIIEVKETGVSTFRTLIAARPSGRFGFNQGNEDGGPFTTRSVTHSQMGFDGSLVFRLDTADQEESFRVFTARTYTVTAQLITSGTVEDTQTFSVVVANVGTAIADTTQQVTFSTSQGNVNQDIIYSYDPSAPLYGSRAHALRLKIPSLATQMGLTIDGVDVGVSYSTTENVSSGTTTFTVQDIDDGTGNADLTTRRLHKIIISFRGSVPPGGNLEAIMALDDNSENTFSFQFPVTDLDWSQIRINGGDEFVVQNIEGAMIPWDLEPAFTFPLHSTLRDWNLHHNNKATDYVWDNVTAPNADIEVVRFPEAVNFEKNILVSPNGTRYILQVDNSGVLSTVEDT